MVLFATAAPQVIQIGTIESILGFACVLVSVGVAWGTLKNSVKNIQNDVKDIKYKVDSMQCSITGHEADITGLKVHTKYGISNSPTIPSIEGERVLEESGFNAQYPKLKPKIFAALDKRKSRTLYDYEVDAFEILQEIKDDPLIDPLKDYAVNHPGEPLEVIFRIASWVVRDDYASAKGTPTQHSSPKGE